MDGIKIILTDNKEILVILEGTKLTRKTADKKDPMRLIHSRTKMAPKQSPIVERQNQVLIYGLRDQTTGFFVKHDEVAKAETKTTRQKTVARATVLHKETKRKRTYPRRYHGISYGKSAQESHQVQRSKFQGGSS